jgi:hypothetical protein
MTTAAIAAAMAVFAGVASAQTYCVAPATGCAVDEPGLQIALDDAGNHAGADTVRLGSATYTTTNNNGFTYTDPGSGDPISIAGASAPGASKIAVAAPGVVPAGMTDYRGLTISNLGGQSSLSDLSIELPTPLVVVPASFPENQHYRAFSDQSNTQVSNVTISSPAGAPIYATGIDSVNSGTQIADSTMSLGSGGANYPSYGVDETNVNPVDMTIARTTIVSDQPLRYTNADPAAELDIDRSILRPRQVGIAATASTVLVFNTLIDLGANAGGVAFDVGFENQNSATASAVGGDGLTVVGSGNGQTGLSVHASTDNTDPLHPEFVDTATTNLLDTVIDLRGTNPIAVNRNDDADGTANVNIDYSSLDATTNSESDGTATTPGATTLGAHNLSPVSSPSGFNDFAGGNYRLDAGSALIDVGFPVDPGPGALDLGGSPRLNDGDGLCPMVRDIGAYEAAGSILDCTPPETTITSGPSGPTTNRRPSFGFSSETGATFECSLDGAVFAACTSPIAPATPLGDGPHTFAVRASDNASPNPPNTDPTPATRSFTVDATGPSATATGRAKVKTKKKRAKAVFTLTASEPGASFQCKVDNGPLVACASPFTTTGLKLGPHTFKATASDALGNTGQVATLGFKIVKKKKKQ